jgi:ribonuclease I
MATFKATWGASPGADLYKIEWFKNGTSLGAPVNAYSTTASKDVTTAQGDMVKAAVAAVNEDGSSAASLSNEVAALPQIPPAPENVVLVQV